MDPIADMLIRIKNAQAANHPAVKVSFSQIKFTIAQILEKEGFLGKVEKKGKDVQKYIKINLKYDQGQPVISGMTRVSKPSRRIYAKKNDIKPVKQGYGIAIISTSSGLMTDQEAKKKRLGGEILCEVW